MIVSWECKIELPKLRHFPLLEGPNYSVARKIVQNCHVNVISVRPGREEKLLALQEVSIDPAIMEELCTAAGRVGIKLWRGNYAHQELLRY